MTKPFSSLLYILYKCLVPAATAALTTNQAGIKWSKFLGQIDPPPVEYAVDEMVNLVGKY